jgi:ribosomal-protein-alanine N-acetyltransferase
MINRTHIPTLTTPRLTLRPFTLDDVAPLHRILNQPIILQYFPNPDSPSIERVEEIVDKQLNHWDEHNLGWWAVVPQGGSELIGWNGLQYLPETDEVEVGYLLSRQFWGRGYATEGAKTSIQFGFENFNFGEIIGLTHPGNFASQNVLKKCGMQFTGQAACFGIQVFRYTLKAYENA